MKNEEKNELIKVSEGISNNLNIFKSDVKRFTSLDLSKEECQMKLLNATQNCDVILNDIVNQQIEINGIYITERPVEEVNNDTGEVIEKSKYTTILFGVDGKTYVAGSYGVYNSIVQIMSIKGMPSDSNTFKLKVIKVPAKTQGHFLLKLVFAF